MKICVLLLPDAPFLFVEGVTRADDQTSEARLRGRLRRLMPVEGVTRAPIIAWPVAFLLFDN